jgi:hypothetical protein
MPLGLRRSWQKMPTENDGKSAQNQKASDVTVNLRPNYKRG